MNESYGDPGTPAPPAPVPYGQAPYGVPPAGLTPPGHYPYGQEPYGAYAPHLYGRPGYGPPGFRPRDPQARPGTVLAAGIVTLVLCGLAALSEGITLIVGIALETMVADDFEGGSLVGDSGVGVLVVVAMVLALIWSVAAILLAVFALRRSQRARIALVASSGLTIPVSLFVILSGGLLAVFSMLGAIAVIVLLFTGGAGEWYAGRHDRDEPVRAY